MKILVSMLLALSLITGISAPASAAVYTNYAYVFTDAIDGTTRWQSPIIDGSGNQQWPTITSKWSEVRDVTENDTSPHVGIDLSITTYKRVAAVSSGTITVLGGSYNTISLKVDSPSNVWCHYEHLASTSGLRDGQTFKAGEFLATAGSAGTGSPHLHFGAYNKPNFGSAGSNYDGYRRGYRNETLYRHAKSWEYGRNCDVFSQVGWNGGSAQVTVVFSGSGNTHREKPAEVRLYYRTTPTGAWIDGGTMSNSGSSTDFVYTYDFTKKTSLASGTTIYWMVRIKRNNSNISYPYMWCPAQFYRPASDPNATTQRYAYRTNILSY